MSFSSDDSYSAPSPLPSPQEFSCIVTNPHMNDDIAQRFASKPSSSAYLRYYKSLSQSIELLEQELERQQMEREALFDQLFDSRSFRTRIRPIVSKYRHEQALIRRGFHPYSHTADSPPSSSSHEVSFPPSSESHTTSNNSSYYTAIDEEPGTSKQNPIVIHNEVDENVCARCKQEGHQREDCDTPMRTFVECGVCAWTKQDTCNHIDASPVWLRELRASVERKQAQLTAKPL
jgi:hypothetical protein